MSKFSIKSNRIDLISSMNFLLLLLFGVCFFLEGVKCGGAVNNEELYKLLNVSKTSTTKEIRISFKKIALVKHPDKNKVDIKNKSFKFINSDFKK